MGFFFGLLEQFFFLLFGFALFFVGFALCFDFLVGFAAGVGGGEFFVGFLEELGVVVEGLHGELAVEVDAAVGIDGVAHAAAVLELGSALP